jgi:hypothetical protein
MLFVPLAVIFKWPYPNYIDPQKRGPAILIVSGIFLFLATSIVALRVWIRITIRRFVGADDMLVMFALVLPLLRSLSSRRLSYLALGVLGGRYHHVCPWKYPL